MKIQLWSLLEKDKLDGYNEVKADNILPSWNTVKKNSKGLPYIHIKGNDFLSYITCDGVE